MKFQYFLLLLKSTLKADKKSQKMTVVIYKIQSKYIFVA